MYTLKKTEQPRELLLKEGSTVLSDSALLALVLGSGIKGKSVHTLAAEVIELITRTNGKPSIKEINTIQGLGPAKAAQITAVLELGRRLYNNKEFPIRTPADAYDRLRHYGDLPQECFFCLSLNGANRIIATEMITKGLVNRTMVHPREVFISAIKNRSAGIIVAHNHPSGVLTPSKEDLQVNLRLQEAGKLIGIEVLDHLIFSSRGFISMVEEGYMTKK